MLRLLNESRGSLLEDAELFATLKTSKATSSAVQESLAVSETTEVAIDRAREVLFNAKCISFVIITPCHRPTDQVLRELLFYFLY